MPKTASGILKALVVVILLLALLYLEENWRGARDWAKCQKELAARGEVLDLRTLCPPDDAKDDLSKVPIFAEVYAQPRQRYEGLIRQDTPKPTRLGRINVDLGSETARPVGADFRRREAVDLSAWQNFYHASPSAHLPSEKGSAAQDVMSALKQFGLTWTKCGLLYPIRMPFFHSATIVHPIFDWIQ